MNTPPKSRLSLAAWIALALLSACAGQPGVPSQSAANASKAAVVRLPARGERVAVTIYEFRSGVPEIGARGATDMFKTALAGQGRFVLVERARLNEGVMREKQLNAAGQSTGRSAQKPLRAADYIFEASITELSAGDRQSQGGVYLGGLQLGGGSGDDSLGIDVRIVDAESGEVRDTVSLRRTLKNSAAQVSGFASLVQTVRAMRGQDTSPLVPDVSLQTSRKDSLDRALRGLIDDAVAQLAARF